MTVRRVVRAIGRSLLAGLAVVFLVGVSLAGAVIIVLALSGVF